jgi:hypothetical protein
MHIKSDVKTMNLNANMNMNAHVSNVQTLTP